MQPEKLAAMEAHWDTTTEAPIHLFAIPDQKNERNLIQFGSIPGVLSFLGHHDIHAEVKGLKDFPKKDRPPVLLTFVSFRLMVALGGYFILMTVYGFIRRNKLLESPRYLRLMLWSIPLPYLAIQFGWLVAELGRQPWIVYHLMRTSDAVSPIAVSQVAVSLAAFLLAYGFLGAIDFYLIAINAKKGPQAAAPVASG